MKMQILAGLAVLAAVSAMFSSAILGAYAQPAYTTVTGLSVSTNPAGTVSTFKISTAGTIPHTADSYIHSVLVFGYAWILAGGANPNVVAATIHPGIRDSTQNPNNWHIHTATLVASSDCSGVGLGLQVTNLKAPEGGLAINGNDISVKLTSNNVPAGTLAGATGFQLVLGANGALCVAAP